MKRILLVGLLVGIALAVIGAEPVKVIMATTDDGRRVILMPDGKWNLVEGAPAPKADQSTCKEKLWDEVYSYLSGQWEIENMDKDAFFVQTKWKTLPFLYAASTLQSLSDLQPGIQVKGSVRPGSVQGKIAIKIQSDCSLKVDTHYQAYFGNNWVELYPEKGRGKVESGGAFSKSNKKVIEFDDKLKADLDSIAGKYMPSVKTTMPSENKP